MKNDKFDQIIIDSLKDEEILTPEETLVNATKNLIKKKKSHTILLNKVYIFGLIFICILFSLEAINLAIKTKNIIIIISVVLWNLSILVLNFVFRVEFKAFLEIKGGQI
ncbi:hypothetical protein CLTEP_26290 [Clostridium tepidiprofundi DSM 19306]|uniref:Uncharacterized protein n=1 Tax=Clostridium tepidiprofundi DSM 19306 TaxID=1121338 RepID=A0A151ASB8_9CLOT|nr:hypothetical protein [Clostridium tepidiprofundi]KYH30482.1 hypothetical protein CLTEP_26290 [Clostridium tepidiprofundi DSM 19306]